MLKCRPLAVDLNRNMKEDARGPVASRLRFSQRARFAFQSAETLQGKTRPWDGKLCLRDDRLTVHAKHKQPVISREPCLRRRKQECEAVTLTRCRKPILDPLTRAAVLYPFGVVTDSDSKADVRAFSLPLGIGGSWSRLRNIKSPKGLYNAH
jgi:hypothetical protein